METFIRDGVDFGSFDARNLLISSILLAEKDMEFEDDNNIKCDSRSYAQLPLHIFNQNGHKYSQIWFFMIEGSLGASFQS